MDSADLPWLDVRGWWKHWDVHALSSALQTVPSCEEGNSPRVQFLCGLLDAMTEGRAALAHWDSAFSSFEAEGDSTGCCLAARASLVLCVIDPAGMRHVREWIARLRRFESAAADVTDGLLAHLAALSAIVLDDAEDDTTVPAALEQAGSPTAQACVDYLRRHLEPLSREMQPDEKLIAAQVLVTYYLQAGQTHHIEDVRGAIELASVYDSASPLMRARWLFTYGFAQYHVSRNDEAKQAWGKGLELAQANSLQVSAAMLSLAFARLHVDLREVETARCHLRNVPRSFGAGREAFRVYREQIAGRIDLLDNMPATALSMLNKSLAAAQSARFSVAECGGCHSDRVQAMLAMEHFTDAIAELKRLVVVHRRRNQEVFRCYLHIVSAWDLRFRDAEEARAELTAGLHLVNVLDFRMFFRLLPSFVADVCALALSWGVERPLIYQILKTRSLRFSAPSHADEHWPWQVWLRMLGDDAILISGRDVADDSKKLPSKTLQLLRYLCSRTTLSADLLDAAMAVWPELVERAGLDPLRRDKLLRRNVEERIRDLRELVGDSSWIKVADSKVRLDARAINSDVCARRRLVQQLRQIADRARVPAAKLHAADLAEADALMSSIAELSRGELLPTYDEYEWVDEARAACDDDLNDARTAVAQIRASIQRGLA